MSDGKLFHRIIERGKKLVSEDDFFTAGTGYRFFENYNHSGKRVVAKALSDKEGPSSTWPWRTTPMCDSQIAVAIGVRQSGAGGRTVLEFDQLAGISLAPHGAGILVVGLLRWRSSKELLTWSYVVGGAECQSSWHSRYEYTWSMWSCQDKRLLIWTPKCLWVVTRGMYELCMKTSDWLRFWVSGVIWRCSLFSALNSMPHD